MLKRTRILLAGMSGMMQEVMEAILALHPEFHLAGFVPEGSDLAAAVRRYRADVLVVMRPRDSGPQTNVEAVFRQRPERVVSIAGNGQDGILYVLRPHEIPLPELSVETLVAAIGSVGSH